MSAHAPERMPLDAPVRQRIRADLDHTLFVEAAAGTGKTSELVRRAVAVLAAGRARAGSLVGLTFTDKAAGELKLRLRAGIESARRRGDLSPDERRHLEEALAHLEEARVGTIHGFCADLLRERSLEARVDPLFETLTEPEARRLYRRAFDLWLQERLEDPPEGLRRALRRPAHDPAGPVGRLRTAGLELLDWRDHPAPWRRPSGFEREAALDLLVDALHRFSDLTRACADPQRSGLHADTEPARRMSDEIRSAEEARGRDYDRLEGILPTLPYLRLEREGMRYPKTFRNGRSGFGALYAPEVRRGDVVAAREGLCHALDEFARAADSDLAALLQVELGEVATRYADLKRRAGRLDFLDLLLAARDLLRECRSVREDFQRRFTHLFVDELQDTDPVQTEVLLLLAGADPEVADWRRVDPVPGKLFLVGDPKQSIYRFRRADIGAYLTLRDHLLGRGAAPVELTTSFRSVPNLQRAVNAAFAPRMAGDPEAQQAGYVSLGPWRSDAPAQPSLVALPVPEPYGARNVARDAIEASLPVAVGAFVYWLLRESGWTVGEGDERVAVAPRHVAVLFRRFESFQGDVTRPYVDALNVRRVPHLLVGGRSFHEREEVETVRNALAAVEWPDDELAVYGTLKGSLFALPDEELLEYRLREGPRLHPLREPRAPVPAHLEGVRDALAVLARLHRGRNARPVDETLALLLEETRAHAGLVLRPAGEQALANVLHVAEQARRHERGGGISFRGFVERLLEDAERGDEGEAPILEEGSEGVRLMTVHRAKGLEFPVVVLADLTAHLTQRRPSRHLDPERGLAAIRLGGWVPVDLLEREPRERERDLAEGVRLAYVAATRARDLLVVPAIGGERWTGGGGDDPTRASWLEPLLDVLYPPLARWGASISAPGCPPMGADSVLHRPEGGGLEQSVRPGLHRLEGATPDGAFEVVWWDPRRLDLARAPRLGVRLLELLDREADPALVEADGSRHAAWREARAEAQTRGRQPTLRVETATGLAAGGYGPAGDEVEVVDLEGDPGRPSGPRFGSLLHAVLATVSFDATSEDLEAAAELQARMLAAPPEEVSAAARLAACVLAHPLLARARAAAARGDCRREAPLLLRLDDGRLLDGVADLAFLEAGRWVVADYKTEREFAERLPILRRQVALYAAAIERATGQPASGVLVRV